MLQHYVFLKYRDGTSDGHVIAFCERMLALRGAIDEIQHLEIGRDELHDARSWDLVLIMEFASVEALRAYQRHPRSPGGHGLQRAVRGERGVGGLHADGALNASIS